MLTEEQKAAIRDEVDAEAYRATLQKRKLSQIPVWEFANSAFGLWLFSAVVVTGLTAGVTRYIEYQNERELKRQCISQLQGELLARYDQLFMLAGMHHNKDFINAAMSGGRKQKYLSIAVGPRVVGTPFSEQPFSVLPITEMLRQIQNSVKDDKVRTAAKFLREDAMLLDLQLTNATTDDSEDTGLAAQILERFWIQYSDFVNSGLGSLDVDMTSKNCLPKTFDLTKSK